MKYLTTFEYDRKQWHFWKKDGYQMLAHTSPHMDLGSSHQVRTPVFYDNESVAPAVAFWFKTGGVTPLAKEVVEPLTSYDFDTYLQQQPGAVQRVKTDRAIDVLILADRAKMTFSSFQGPIEILTGLQTQFHVRVQGMRKMEMKTAHGIVNVTPDVTGTVFQLDLVGTDYELVLYTNSWYDPMTTLYNVVARLASVRFDLVEFQEIMLREFVEG